ncbi:glycoside hydrolase family 13 protein [Thermogladius sp. 4427co]|uniref:glycoside hydrolase family 13 protein n=1 Tax=Thermogladius sp. 4427co TaxID=3450718 RepID=UPI003F79FBEF
MYRILGRSIIEGGRQKNYLVEFKTRWVSGARRMYLVANFTSWFPGFKRMAKLGDEARIIVPLYPGVYGYWFTSDYDPTPVLDPDNGETVEMPNMMHPERNGIRASLLVVKPPVNPLDYFIHDERDPAYLSRIGGFIVFRVRTLKNVDSVELYLNGRRYSGIIRDLPFERVFEFILEDDGESSYISYHFEFEYEGRIFSYGFNGVGEIVQPIIVDKNRIPGSREIKWFTGTIYYQIFVDSFYNGDPGNDPPYKISRLAPREHGYYGGDLKGIVDKIDHLSELGVEAIYLTPIFPAGTYHRYDVRDYFGIDRYLGGLEDFETLVEKFSERGMRLVLDITIHHTGACHPFFIDALSKGVESRYWEWFNFLDNPSKYIDQEVIKALEECDIHRLRDLVTRKKIAKPFYESFFSNWIMPKINHENKDTLEYFIQIARYWMEKGVSGFRLDVAHGVMDEWLEGFYSKTKELNPDFLLLGEICDYPFLYSGYMDSYMNYWLRYWIISTIVFKKHSIKEMVEMVNLQISNHPYYQLFSLYNMLGSHDTTRIKTLVGGDKRVLKLLVVLLFILPGSPAIYYGDEVGLEGGPDPDNRRPMIWDKRLWDTEMYETYLNVIKLRKSFEELRYGFAEVKACNDSVIVVKRWLRREIAGVFNTREGTLHVGECLGFEPTELLMSSSNSDRVEPYGFRIFLIR